MLAYLRARIAAHRSVLDDPSVLAAEAARVFGAEGRSGDARTLAAAARIWSPDGGLSANDVAQTLAFFKSDALRRLRVEDVADLRFLTDVNGSR